MSSAADVVMGALDALKARDWKRLAARLHPDVVHRTPGVPDPILGSVRLVGPVDSSALKTRNASFGRSR